MYVFSLLASETCRFKVPQVRLLYIDRSTLILYANEKYFEFVQPVFTEITWVNSHQNRNRRSPDWLMLEGTGSSSNNLRMCTADQLCTVSYWCLVACVNLGLVCFRILDNLKQLIKIHFWFAFIWFWFLFIKLVSVVNSPTRIS